MRFPARKNVAAEAKKKAKEKHNAQRVKPLFVFTLGDEGAVLLHLQRGRVTARYFTPSLDAPETAVMTGAVTAEPKTPVIILLDTSDQSYVQQALPPVSQFSLKKLMQRRLEREFPGAYIKSALLLGREKAGRRDWNFLMVALPVTGILTSWLNLVLEWPNRCLSVHALPVEMAQVAQKISALTPADQVPWQLVVSHNKVSGLRQAVFRAGKLVLTRVSQPAVGEDPEALAGAVEQDINSTLSYLRRLMPRDEDNVALTIIVAQAVREHIDTLRLSMHHILLTTPHELAMRLNLNSATQPADSYGDVMLAALIGASVKHELILSVPEHARQLRYYTGLTVLRVAACVAGFALVAISLQNLWNIISTTREIVELQDQNTQRQQEMTALNEKASKSTEDLEKIANVVSLYELLGRESYSPLPLLLKTGGIIGGQARILSYEWKMQPPAKDARADAKLKARLALKLQFSPALAEDRKQLQAAAVEVLNRLKTGLEGFEVSYETLPGAASEGQQITLSLAPGQAAAPKAVDNSQTQASLVIQGPATAWEAAP